MSVNTSGEQRTANLHAEIQQFYAYQMHLLDDGNTDGWADTFTEDGIFGANAHPEPTRGRETIRAAAKAAAERRDPNLQVRHWLGMLDVQPQPDGSAHARSYALILNTVVGESPKVHLSTTCEDVLVRGADGQWLVSSRQVYRDDLR
jgi:ketosteroid isomerase-like protein